MLSYAIPKLLVKILFWVMLEFCFILQEKPTIVVHLFKTWDPSSNVIGNRSNKYRKITKYLYKI